MPSLLLIRHAQASYGTADYDVLSQRGAEQVSVLHGALRARGVHADTLVSGDLRRQRDTAAPFAGALETDARWNEYDAADILGAHSDAHVGLERRPGDDTPVASSVDFQRLLDDAMLAWIAAGAASPARESWPAFRDRVRAALDDAIARLGRGQIGLVFTSGGVIAAVCLRVLGLPDTLLPTFNRTSVNASVTKLIIGGRGTSLASFNEHAHLEPDLVSFR